MSKYKVGDELIIVTDPNQETKKLKDLSFLKKDGDFACLSWGIKIVDVLYEKPNVTLTYKNVMGETNNFDHEKVLEKALLKAFQNELTNITVIKNSGLKTIL